MAALTVTTVNILYIVAAVGFILGIKMLSSPQRARVGNALSAAAMLLAIVVTLLQKGIIDYRWLSLGLLVGAVIGGIAARRVAMTAMPQLVAVLNGFGGIASLLVAWSEYHRLGGIGLGAATEIAMILALIIGGVTFTGSLVAYGKLSGRMFSGAVTFGGQHILNLCLLFLIAGCAIFFIGHFYDGYGSVWFFAALGLALLLGVLLVIPIGGADMPVVIALLNSYSGLAACAAGFVILNNVLIVAGALVGASGIILTDIMCKAMNRTLLNVLFGGFGSTVQSGHYQSHGEARSISVDDSWLMLEAAQSVVIVPGYGMAVAQAQHVVRELGELLMRNGAEVSYAIHPVAGRMPGHMNVLLAEADVAYEQLLEADAINSLMDTVDVCIVIGANDVVNPAARDDETSPIYGMPIVEVDKARTVIILKRSLAPGFAGIDNPLFFNAKTRMLFGDAKASVQGLVNAFKS